MSLLSDITAKPEELAAKDAARAKAQAQAALAEPAVAAAAPAQPASGFAGPHLVRDAATGQQLVEDSDGGIWLRGVGGALQKFAPEAAGKHLADERSGWFAAAPADVKEHQDQQTWDHASLAAKSDFVARRALVNVADAVTAVPRLGAKLVGASPELDQKLSGENIVRKLDTLLAGEETAAQESQGARELEAGAPTALKLGTDVAGLVAGGAALKGVGTLAKLAGVAEGSALAKGASALTLEGAGELAASRTAALAESFGLSAERAAKLGAYADTVAQGAAIGNTQAAHEAWIKDEKLTSEAQWNAIGLGALLGVGGHVAVDALRGLPRAGLTAAEKVFGKPRISTSAADAEAQDLVESLSGVKQPEGTGAKVQGLLDHIDEKLTSLQSKVSGVPEEKLATYKKAAPEIERLAADRDQIFADGTRDLTKHLETLHSESQGILQETSNVAMKKQHMARLLADADETPIMQLAKNKAAEFNDGLANLNAANVRGRSTFGSGKAVADIKAAYEDAIDSLASASKKEDVASALDVFKRQLDSAKVRAEQLSRNPSTFGIERQQAAQRVELAREVANNVRSLLEDESIFGKFGEAQRESNAAWTRALESDKYVRGQFFKRTGEISGTAEYGAARHEIDPAAVERYLNGLGTARSQLADGYLRDNLEARANLVETLGKYYDIGEHSASIEAASKAAKGAQATLGKLDETLRALNLRDEVLAHGAAAAGHSHDGIATAAMLGHMLGGPVGSGVALVAKAASKVLGDPVGFTKQMLQMRAGAKKLASSIENSIGKALERAPSVRSGAVTAGARVLASREAPEKLQRRYASTAAKVQELASDPNAAIEAVSNSAQHISHPGVQQAYVNTGLNVLGFLVSKLPQPLYQDAVAKGSQLNNVSATQRDTFMRYADAANKPADFFKALASGAATQEQAETAAALMPAAFEHAQQQAILAFASGKVKADYQTRLNLQRLLQIQIEPVAAPGLQQFLAGAAQQASAQQQQAQQQTPKRGSAGASSAASSLKTSLSNLKI